MWTLCACAGVPRSPRFDYRRRDDARFRRSPAGSRNGEERAVLSPLRRLRCFPPDRRVTPSNRHVTHRLVGRTRHPHRRRSVDDVRRVFAVCSATAADVGRLGRFKYAPFTRHRLKIKTKSLISASAFTEHIVSVQIMLILCFRLVAEVCAGCVHVHIFVSSYR